MTEKNIDMGEESILEEEWESYLRQKEQRKKCIFAANLGN